MSRPFGSTRMGSSQVESRQVQPAEPPRIGRVATIPAATFTSAGCADQPAPEKLNPSPATAGAARTTFDAA
jgi:hypothetical protein